MKRILAFIIVACLAVFVFIPGGNQKGLGGGGPGL